MIALGNHTPEIESKGKIIFLNGRLWLRVCLSCSSCKEITTRLLLSDNIAWGSVSLSNNGHADDRIKQASPFNFKIIGADIRFGNAKNEFNTIKQFFMVLHHPF